MSSELRYSRANFLRSILLIARSRECLRAAATVSSRTAGMLAEIERTLGQRDRSCGRFSRLEVATMLAYCVVHSVPTGRSARPACGESCNDLGLRAEGHEGRRNLEAAKHHALDKLGEQKNKFANPTHIPSHNSRSVCSNAYGKRRDKARERVSLRTS